MNAGLHRIRTIAYAALLLVAAGLAALQIRQGHKQQDSPPQEFGRVPEFSLTTENRRTFTSKDLSGKVTIADFVFTSCAGPCPLMSAELQRLQGELKERPLAQFVSFSVDPETDTPEVLTEYAKRFGAINGKWIFLTGEKKTIYDLTRNGFHLAVEADSDAIAHSTKFVLIDTHAEIRGYYDSEDEEALKKLVHDAKELME